MFATIIRALLPATLLLALAGCVDPYMPDVITAPRSYLVVDGFINSQGVTQIKLSRTYNLTDGTPPVEARATVYIEDEAGGRFPLRETTAGLYLSDALTLDAAQRYRLTLSTRAGRQYASDFVPVKTTPAIDSISWEAAADELRIKVSSHDSRNATQFYRWNYEETWEFAPIISTRLEYSNETVHPRDEPYPDRCWRSQLSTSINIGKTTNLSQDVLANHILRKLPNTTELLYRKYSILVKQHGMTRAEYDYWDLLRKNTESIGTLFDPLPSQLTGNVHCLDDAEELALGFVGVHSITEKRIFISRSQLPRNWPLSSGYAECLHPDSIINDPPIAFPDFLRNHFGPNYKVPVQEITEKGSLIGYTASTVDCLDCRRRGTSVRPSFWQ
jgi:hypothetical protein